MNNLSKQGVMIKIRKKTEDDLNSLQKTKMLTQNMSTKVTTKPAQSRLCGVA